MLLAEQFVKVAPAELGPKNWWIYPPPFFANLSVHHFSYSVSCALSLRKAGQTGTSGS